MWAWAGLGLLDDLGPCLAGWARPVGPEAGWAGLTGLVSRRFAGWAEPSLRHSRRSQKWTHGAGRRRTPKISRPAGQDFGPADMGGVGEKIVKGDLKELKILLLFFLSTNEKHIEKPSIN